MSRAVILAKSCAWRLTHVQNPAGASGVGGGGHLGGCQVQVHLTSFYLEERLVLSDQVTQHSSETGGQGLPADRGMALRSP